jgi:hypothetical protein
MSWYLSVSCECLTGLLLWRYAKDLICLHSLHSVSKEFAVVEYIVSRFPALATIPDASGRLPLQLALESGRTWYSGIRELVAADPVCLTTPDRPTRLYPFQLAAARPRRGSLLPPQKKRRLSNGTTSEEEYCDEWSTEEEHIGTIFHLLRECPNLVKSSL